MVYIITHKKCNFPTNTEEFAVIQAGAENNEDLGYLRDNVGDNISGLNPYFCELTGMYWIWKNVEADYIGICHYRRFFAEGKQIINELKLRDALADYDLVLPRLDHFAVSVYKQYEYSSEHNISDLDMAIKCISIKYPDYRDILNEVMIKKAFYPYNMMYMRKSLYHQYCEWLFTILFELMKQIPYNEYTGQKKRVFGYLSERLLLIWIRKNKLKVKELNVVNTETKVTIKEKIFRRANSYLATYMGIDLREKK